MCSKELRSQFGNQEEQRGQCFPDLLATQYFLQETQLLELYTATLGETKTYALSVQKRGNDMDGS